MSRHMLIALGGGVVSALIAVAMLMGSPGALMIVYLAPLPLFLVGLSGGAAAATVASVSGLLVAGFMGGMVAAAIYGLIHALPAWVMTRQSLRTRVLADGSVVWHPVGHALAELSGLGAVVFVSAAAAAWYGGGSIMDSVAAYLNAVLATVFPDVPDAQRDQYVGMLTPIFPGFTGSSWLVMAVVNGALAQAILVRLGKNLRPNPRFNDLTAPEWLSWLLVGSAVLVLLGSGEMEYVGRNLAVILAVPFFFVGLAVVHTLAGRVPSPGMLLIVFYVIVVFSGWAMMAVAGIGLIEQWVGLRRRFAGPRNGQEVE